MNANLTLMDEYWKKRLLMSISTYLILGVQLGNFGKRTSPKRGESFEPRHESLDFFGGLFGPDFCRDLLIEPFSYFIKVEIVGAV